MGILLGLAAAALYGSSDFIGGLASRRLSSVAVNVVGSAVATALAWAALGLSDAPAPSTRAIVWGLIGAVGGGVGSLVLYRGLARGRMSVVGPISAVGAAVIPVMAGVALGERPGVLAVAGVLVALPAIALVAGAASHAMFGTGMTDGLMAGAAFGLMFVALAQAGAQAGLWPVVFEQTGQLVFMLAIAARSRKPLGLTVRNIGMPIVAGATGMVATLLYFFATHLGMLTTIAILTSLYPAVTVVLARLVTHERLGIAQRIGFGLCAIAVVAIAVN